MEKHLELKERFDRLMKQDMDVSEHEQEWLSLIHISIIKEIGMEPNFKEIVRTKQVVIK